MKQSNHNCVSMTQLKDTQKKLKEHYNVDVIEDIILAQKTKIVCFLDYSQSQDAALEIVSGCFSMIGFSNSDSITLSQLLNHFDYDNAYAKVSGKKQYYQTIKQLLYDFTREPNVTFPIRTDEGKFWLRFELVTIKKRKDSAAIFITNVTPFLIEEEALFDKTHRDSLTGLFNKYTLDYHYGKRYKKKDFHVLFLDLDNFKPLNDTLGHNAGNRFLRLFSDMLHTYESDLNHFYRIGGDEFIGLFFKNESTVKAMAKSIIKNTRALTLEDYQEKITVSIGIVKAVQGEDVIKKADKILYQAKQKGKDCFMYAYEDDVKS